MTNSFFQWDEAFVTGWVDIDLQHRDLLETVNDLIRLNFIDNHVNLDEIASIRDKLTVYVQDHFRLEHEMMHQYDVDSRHVDQHVKLHNEFVQNVQTYFSDLETFDDHTRLEELSEYLIRWLAYHILNTDKSMVRQIEAIKNEGLTNTAAYDKDVQLIDHSSEPLLKALKALFYLVSEKNKELENKVAQRTAELEEANKKLQEWSLIDELTGLPNRRSVLSEIERLIQEYRRYGSKFSILFIDLNKFKAVNDTYGHEKGDEVLKWVATYLRNNLRVTDIPGRLGGDEFIVICPHLDSKSALQVANKLLAFEDNCKMFKCLDFWEASFSIGVAEINQTIKTASELLSLADSIMYEVKKMGINGVRAQM